MPQSRRLGKAVRRFDRQVIRQVRPVRIVFYMPFKPLDHPRPSGDLVIGSDLFGFLKARGHDIRPVSRLRTRWIFWKPWQWVRLPLEIGRARRLAERFQPQLWLTYHSYYKAPDLLGALCAPAWKIPYAVFQGVYATKYRRRPATAPGFLLNRFALRRAALVFTNKRRDEAALRRLLPADRLHYIAPGIRPGDFQAADVGTDLKRTWGASGLPVVLTAAMFRPGVKHEGIARVIAACSRIADRVPPFKLVVCGDGAMRASLERQARNQLGDAVHFAGRVPRERMRHYYGNADLFAFPGIREGLWMVFLEAQAAGLPVVACSGWGASEVVRHGETGFLSPAEDGERFERHIMRLLLNPTLRRTMGRSAADHVARHHDLACNYTALEHRLRELAERTGAR